MKKIYCIFDVSAGIAHHPFIAENNVMAMRSFESAMEKLPPQMSASEMALLCLGEFTEILPPNRSLISDADYPNLAMAEAARANEIYSIEHYTNSDSPEAFAGNPAKCYKDAFVIKS